MSSTTTIADTTFSDAPASHSVAELLICLPSLPAAAMPSALEAIAAAFPNESVLVASADIHADATSFPSLELIPYTSSIADIGWVLAVSDFAAAAHIAVERNARAVILLGDDNAPINPSLLRDLADTVRTRNIDLALPRFATGPNDALVNSALLYPLSRALFGADTTQRLVTLNQGSSLLWPVAEACIAGYSVREISADNVLPPTPPQEDFNALFATVAGSLFADIDAKATFWQRARNLPFRPTSQPIPPLSVPEAPDEIHSMVEAFRLAQGNLQEIWSLVLPPQTRLALKKLAQLPPDAFLMEPDLWARVVYDFTLAFHLRTLNRSHLLGAMTPIYLAWVASHLRTVADDPTRAARAIEDTAQAFELEKSYIVSRWRWPDRFNP
jgi:hypothetical protein